MKKPIIIAVAIFAASCAHARVVAQAPAAPPPVVKEPAEVVVLRSLVRVTGVDSEGNERFICTGWSIAPRKFVTAAHCTATQGEDLFEGIVNLHLEVDGMPALMLRRDEETDLALLLADEVKPSLTIRERPLEMFEAVQAAGFGHGVRSPLVTDHRVMILNYQLAPDIYPGTVFMHPFIGGMSGGPIFDSNAEVVGEVQRGSNFIAYGVSTDTMMKFLGMK